MNRPALFYIYGASDVELSGCCVGYFIDATIFICHFDNPFCLGTMPPGGRLVGYAFVIGLYFPKSIKSFSGA